MRRDLAAQLLRRFSAVLRQDAQKQSGSESADIFGDDEYEGL